jgi:hypothetical protein
MVQAPGNPGGLPKSVFDGFQAALAADRSGFYRDVAAGPFYGCDRPGAKSSEAEIQNWWRQGMMGGAKAHYDGIVAFSQTDFTDDLKKIGVPVFDMHGDDDQIVPYPDSAPLSAKLLKNRTLTVQGLSAGYADHACGNHQGRPARLHQGLNCPTAHRPRRRHDVEARDAYSAEQRDRCHRRSARHVSGACSRTIGWSCSTTSRSSLKPPNCCHWRHGTAGFGARRPMAKKLFDSSVRCRQNNGHPYCQGMERL